MSKDKYDPPEADIEKVLKQTDNDPRKLAIAYLRAQNRAKTQTLLAKVNEDMSLVMAKLMLGDLDGATEAARKGTRRLKTVMKGEDK